MRKQIVIVGHSPASQFLAELLDQSLARLVQAKVLWLSAGSPISYLPAKPTIFGHGASLGEAKLNHVKRSSARVRSISLVDRTITTERGTVDYDYLILDQGQAITEAERLLIRRELTTLVASLKAGANTGQARLATVTVNGNSADRLALAAAIAYDLRRHFPVQSRRIRVRVNCLAIDETLEAYLRAIGVERTRGTRTEAGMTIAASAPLVPTTAVRGLQIDRTGHAISNHGQLDKFPEVTVVDSHDRPNQGLLRFERSLARQLAKKLEASVETGETMGLQLHGQAFLLNGGTPFVRLGSMTSRRYRAQAVLGLERRLLAGR